MSFVMAGALLMTTGCSSSAKEGVAANQKDMRYTASKKAMDTTVSVILYGCGSNEIANSALELCEYYEGIFSRTNRKSLLYEANDHNGFDVESKESKVLLEVLQKGLEYCELTKGAFDITVEPITSLWNFGSNKGTVPSDIKIKEALEKVDYTAITLTEEHVDFGGARIDLGAIAKGYVAERIREYLLEQGVDSAILNLGGNICAIGKKFGESEYSIGIQKPFGAANELIKTLSLTDCSVVTSGVYERYFVVGSTHYHHLMNPKTGYPADNGLYSVTIIAKDSTMCDALSTGCFVLGLEEGLALVESLEGVEAIFVDDSEVLYYSSGAQALCKDSTAN